MDTKQIDKRSVQLHHVSSHFTNGLFPTSLFFLLLAFFCDPSYERVSFLLLVIASIASPFTYISGIVDWILRFKKARTPIFNKKVYYGILLLVLSVSAVCWRYHAGDSILQETIAASLYLFLNIIITAIVTYLGYLGGKFTLR